MSEKTEKATAHKLQKAREKGQVSKSAEFTTYSTLLCILGLLFFLSPHYVTKLQQLLSHLFYLTARLQFNTQHLSYLIHLIALQFLSLWLPVALLLLTIVSLCTIYQTGLTWSPAALTPNFKRLNIAQGFKKLCSVTSIFDACKALIKLVFSFVYLGALYKNQLHSLVQTALTPSINHTSLMIHFILASAVKLVILLLALAVIDKKFMQWKFQKEQRMSKHEVKEEYKQKEGDPKIKQKIRQLQLQLRQRTTALAQVKTADVIITNPTHIAIALKYQRGEMPAPKVVYKAQDKMVEQVKELAKKHRIPLIEHKVLARMLHYSTELNHYINKELFPLTAQVFRDLYRHEAVR